jgi:uncharacterized membrane-anchored protein
MAAHLLDSVRNNLNGLVAVRFNSGNIIILLGTEILNRIRSGQLRIEDIAGIQFRGTLRLIPVAPDGMLEGDTFNVLYELSDDFADNNEAITFWYLQDISNGAVHGVFRDSAL